MATPAQLRKVETDKKRKRRGAPHRKRLHVLNNPEKLAFRGWEDEPDMWTMATCEFYIEWCHIDKKFHPSRHYYHRHTNKANLKYCECPDFRQRCIEVYQVLYGMPCVERNEVSLFLARGVYAEVALGKRVDWTTVKEAKHVKQPTTSDIPRGILAFPDAPNGGMGVTRSTPASKANEDISCDTATSEEDADSDGSRAQKALRRVGHGVPSSEGMDGGGGVGSSLRGARSNRPPIRASCTLPRRLPQTNTSSSPIPTAPPDRKSVV